MASVSLTSSGISFADYQTPAGGMANELFDHYEEGYHAVSFSANFAVGSSTAKLQYTKIGSTLMVNGNIACSSVSASTAWAASLPFTIASNTQSTTVVPSSVGGGVMHTGLDTGGRGIALYLPAGQAEFRFYQLLDNASWLRVNNSHWTAGDEVYIQLTCHTA